MAVTKEKKQKYQQLIKKEKEQLEDLDQHLKVFNKAIKDNKKLDKYYRLAKITKFLLKISLYLEMNKRSELMMETKNNTYLDLARKDIYNIFGEINQIITLAIDEPIDFNREQLNTIIPFNVFKRYNLYIQLKNQIHKLIAAYGDNTKWKWSFPEFWGKLAITGKNFFDFREYQKERDPRNAYYDDRINFLDTIKEDLFFAATGFANKFRLSTQSNNDMRLAIQTLDSLKRICKIVGDNELYKKCQSGIESYKASIEAEEKKKKDKR